MGILLLPMIMGVGSAIWALRLLRVSFLLKAG